MRVGHLNVTRPNWYDRTTLITGTNGHADDIGPHAETDRYTYTVPVGVRTFIDAVYVNLCRASSATDSKFARARWISSPTTGGEGAFVEAAQDSSERDPMVAMLSQCGQLQTADQLIFRTNDPSTGGTENYSWGVKLNEYTI